MVAKTIYVLILLLHVERLFCKSNDLQCKPKPGCHITQCDPGPPGFINHLRRNEYPITCVRSTSETDENLNTRQDFDMLFDLVMNNLKEVARSREDMVSLRKGRFHLFISLRSHWFRQVDLSNIFHSF